MRKPFYIDINNTVNLIDLAVVRNIKLIKSTASFNSKHELQVFDHNGNKLINETIYDLEKAVKFFSMLQSEIERA